MGRWAHAEEINLTFSPLITTLLLTLYFLVYLFIYAPAACLPVAPRPVKIPTLDRFKPPTRFHIAELFSVRESGSQAVLSAAKFLLGVSSSLGL